MITRDTSGFVCYFTIGDCPTIHRAVASMEGRIIRVSR